MSVSKKTRFEVFKRDGFTCQYCGKVPPDIMLECDHIHPVAENGTDDLDNLITACFDCNRGKSDRLLSVIPATVAERLVLLKEKEEQLKEYNELLLNQRQANELRALSLSDYWMRKSGHDPIQYQLSDDRMTSMLMFCKRLPFASICEAIDIAFQKKPWNSSATWKYFCGTCWKMIKGN